MLKTFFLQAFHRKANGVDAKPEVKWKKEGGKKYPS
jgi:hypothetical protein